MKRTIGLIIIFILEIAFGVIYYVKDIWNVIITALPFLEVPIGWIKNVFTYFKGLLTFDLFTQLPNLAQNIIIVIALNIVFVIVYLIIFGIIAAIQRSNRRRKIEKIAQKKFSLSDEEKAKFDWKLYERRFPIRRIFSLLIPTLVVALFVLIRFDKSLCSTVEGNVGYFDVYNFCKPYIEPASAFIDNIFTQYMLLNNRIVEALGVTWVEWVEIGLVYVILCLLWWGFFSIFAKPFRKHLAKRRAKKAKNRYVAKMEYLEYKALKKAQKEASTSQKNREFFEEEAIISENRMEVTPIAVSINATADNDNSLLKERASAAEREYIDDIATGVTDLGVVEEDTSEIQEAITVRETQFVGEEEIDITLEEEPVIETIEEEDTYYNDMPEAEEGFERYQPETTSSLEIEDKIKKYNINVIDELNENTTKFEDDTISTIKDYEDKDVEYAINQNNVESEIKENQPVEEEKSAEEVQSIEKVVQTTENEVQAQKDEVVQENDKTEQVIEDNKEESTEEITDETISYEENKANIKPLEVNKPVEEDKEEIVKPIIKPKSVEVINLKKNSKPKPSRPLDVNEDRSKVVEYILKTNTRSADDSIISSNEEKVEESIETPKEIEKKVVKPIHKIDNKKKNIKPIAPLDVKKKKK